MTTRARRLDRGQAAVELALVLPLIAVLLLAVVQVGTLARDQVLVVHAAREAAREAAVQEADTEADEPAQLTRIARKAALDAVGAALRPARLTVELTATADRIAVGAGYRAPIWLPIVRLARKDVRLVANAQIRREKD